LQSNRTTFIISHRLATIRRANKIILLSNNGTIELIGSHKYLLANSANYKRIFRIETETPKLTLS
ncbi:MAG: multidrug ABC transporter ATP-binding protein, partial [Candidatus Thorarchaeota archaeon]